MYTGKLYTCGVCLALLWSVACGDDDSDALGTGQPDNGSFPNGEQPIAGGGGTGVVDNESGNGTESNGAGGTDGGGDNGTSIDLGAAGGTGLNGTEPSSGDAIQRGPEPTKQSASSAGPYNVDTYTSGYEPSSAYAEGTIHYPTDADPPFAIMAVVPGFVSPQSSIQSWGPFLASHGIVSITIGTNSGFDQPPARAEALMGALGSVMSEHTRSGSPLEGVLDESRQGVMGWSMGGGGALIAGENNSHLKVAISLAGWGSYRFPDMTTASLMFAATADTLASGMSGPFYDSIPESTPKLIYEVQGGNHNMFNDPASQSGEVGRYGLSWCKVFLEGDDRYRQFLTEQPDTNMADFRHTL